MSTDSRPLHILQVGAFGFPSDQGSQVYVDGMCTALARRGHRVQLACYGHGSGEDSGEYELLRIPRVPGYDRMRAGPDCFKPFLDLMLAMKIAGERPDVLHAHNYEAPLSARLGRYGRSIPLFYSAHTLLEQELPSYFVGRGSRRAARRMGWALDRVVPRLADHAIVLKESTRVELGKLGCKSVSLQEPGIDRSDLVPTKPLCNDGPWVIYTGNPDSYQELEVLVEAMSQIEGAGLLLVGSSSFEGLDLGAIDRVRVIEEREFGRVRGWLASAAVAVLPRSQCAGYPIKLLNYLGMGLPTVAARGSARSLPGMIRVTDGSSTEMASAIRLLLDDPVVAKRLGRQGRDYVLDKCTWEARAVELERLYRTFCDLRRLGHGRRLMPQCPSQG